ncbi:MAG TPA: hypothetical protein VEI03_12695 [Stellaceae bacterium]|nr:hypothetical protein [Stellaceae bacterium]
MISDGLIEIAIVIVYVTCFGITLHGWTSPEAWAFTPELSTASGVLYVKTTIGLWGHIATIVEADTSAQTIRAYFQLVALFVVVVLAAAVLFGASIRLVRAYLAPQGGPEAWTLMWRANRMAIYLAVALNIFAAYIRAMEARYVLD